MGNGMGMDSCVYMEDGQIRRIRGTITDDGSHSDFVVIRRADAEVRIAKAAVVKLEFDRRRR